MSCACEKGTWSPTALGSERGSQSPSESDSDGGEGHRLYRLWAQRHKVENGKKSQQIGIEGQHFVAPLALFRDHIGLMNVS